MHLKPLVVGKPNLGSREIFLSRVEEILDSRVFSNDGPFAKRFEDAICQYTGAQHCIATCNATVALEIVLRALGLNGEVIIPSYTFVATAHAIQWLNLRPVFCDINEDHLLDPEKLVNHITPDTEAILAVNLWGRSQNIPALERIAKEHNLALVFDSSHAFACSHNGRRLGVFGNAEVFSFHATKFVNSFEGGAIVTNDTNLADRIRSMKSFGFVATDQVEHLGTNGKMCEIAAAMGLTNLEAIDDIVKKNRENYFGYKTYLSDIPYLKLLDYTYEKEMNFQYIVVELTSHFDAQDRDTIVHELISNNIFARKYFWPCVHRMSPYIHTHPEVEEHLPMTRFVADRVIVLPTGQTVNQQDIKYTCDIIRSTLQAIQKTC